MTEIDSDYSRAAWPPPSLEMNGQEWPPTHILSLFLSLCLALSLVSRVSHVTVSQHSGTLSLSIEENLDRSFPLDPALGARAAARALIRDLDEERLRGLVQ